MESNDVVAQLTITICGAVAAGLLALLGSWVGSHWGKKTEHAQWFRNEQLRHVGTYLHLQSQLNLDMTSLVHVAHDRAELAERRTDFKNRVLEMSNPTFRLVASTQLIGHAETAQQCLLEKMDLILSPPGTERDRGLRAIEKKFDHIEEAMINSARASFGAKGSLNFYPALEE